MRLLIRGRSTVVRHAAMDVSAKLNEIREVMRAPERSREDARRIVPLCLGDFGPAVPSFFLNCNGFRLGAHAPVGGYALFQ